jgi:hypothetical protein
MATTALTLNGAEEVETFGRNMDTLVSGSICGSAIRPLSGRLGALAVVNGGEDGATASSGCSASVGPATVSRPQRRLG